MKDTIKSRSELHLYCQRRELEKDQRTRKFPKATYVLDKKQKEEVFNWLKSLKFPDG